MSIPLREPSPSLPLGLLAAVRRQRYPRRLIYVVEEGETLHSISDKCGDPDILEQNPHVHDPDDVFPGLVIKITPRPRSGPN
ncbi:hypothetical protein E2562_020315 [Oryza meyeriana var. granulata]|uniref:LysM domain-containing protein n=1 Tax=Oryza meyeriana var. granulata TaxID=110450 RepID=A0A6G1EBQ0_9ORYZ|nr:hypothetical protein E2562_020315 [Oryza meyeriana var. granulata]